MRFDIFLGRTLNLNMLNKALAILATTFALLLLHSPANAWDTRDYCAPGANGFIVCENPNQDEPGTCARGFYPSAPTSCELPKDCDLQCGSYGCGFARTPGRCLVSTGPTWRTCRVDRYHSNTIICDTGIIQ